MYIKTPVKGIIRERIATVPLREAFTTGRIGGGRERLMPLFYFTSIGRR